MMSTKEILTIHQEYALTSSQLVIESLACSVP